MAIAGRKILPLLWLLAVAAATAAVYYPGLSGGWLIDDQQNIVQNTDLQAPASLDSIWTAAISNESGPLRRPISMLSFWANFHLDSNAGPRQFKITNLAIHILNGLIVFWFLTGLFDAYVRKRGDFTETHIRWVAAFGATLWLIHPLALTNVLYVVQRMNSLAGTFTLLAVGTYVHGRNEMENGRPGWRWIMMAMFLLTPLAMFSKEDGVLAPVFMWIIEYCIYQFESVRRQDVTWLKRGFLAALGIPAFAAAAYITVHPEFLFGSYHIRQFTLIERLMTEARVVWSYVGWILVPTPGRLGLTHDDIAISHGLFHPATTVIAIAGWAIAIATAFRIRRRLPLVSFAILWFLGGQLLESTVFGLEIAFEHRLYMPMVAPLAVAAYYLCAPRHATGSLPRHALLAGLIGVFAFNTFVRASEWSDNRTMALYEVKHHPDSPRANVQAGIVFADLLERPYSNTDYNRQEAQFYFHRAAELDPTDVSSVFDLLILHGSHNLPFDKQFVDWAVKRMQARPIHPRILSGFMAMVQSLQSKKAKIPEPIVRRIFQAAISNPGIAPSIRAGIYAQMSKYFMDVQQDPQSAVAMAIAATKENPAEPIHHLDLAKLAITLGRLDIADKQIRKAQQLDRLGEYAAAINSMDAIVHAAEAGAADTAPVKSKRNAPASTSSENAAQAGT